MSDDPATGHAAENGQFSQAVDFTLAAQQNITGDFTTPFVFVGDAHTLRVALDVTGGTFSTADVTIESSDDQTEVWLVETFAQATGVGSERKGFSGLGKYVRAVIDLDGGATDLDFNIKGALVKT